MSELKPQLLRLSEEIVSLSDRMDEIEFEESGSERYKIISRLKAIGDELVGILEKAQGDDLAFTHFALGSVCALLGYFKKAEEAYDAALDHWPDHVGILNEAYDVLIELGKFEKARNFIERSMKHGGETPDVLYNYASLISHMGRIDEARITLINALARFPNDRGMKALLQELDLAKAQKQ